MIAFPPGALPLAIAGVAAAAAPILIHLFNKARYREIDWGAMDFLLEAAQRSRSLLRFRDLWLLVLRSAAVVLFGLAVARPFLRLGAATGSAGGPVHAVVVIDNSLSMMRTRLGGTTLLDDAKARAKDCLANLPAGSRATVMPLCGPAGSYSLDPHRTQDDAVEAVEGIRCVDRAGTVVQAIDLASQAADRAPDLAAKRILFIGDQQAAAWPADVKPLLAAGGRDRGRPPLDLQAVAVAVPETDNTWVESFAVTDGVADVELPATLTAVIRHEGSQPRRHVQVSLAVDAAEVATETIDLEPGQAREVTFSHLFDATVEPGKPAFAAGLTTTGQVTAIGQALEELSLRHSAANLQGVVLVSDFDQNAGPPAAAAARRLGVPFYCLGVGPGSAADVAVDAQAPPVMKQGERSLVTVTLRQSGLDGAAAEVTVTARPLDGPAATTGGALLDLGTRSVPLSAGVVSVEFPFTPAEVGRHEFVAEVAKLEGESIDANNRAVRESIVRDDYLRLEYVEYEPTWEWRFVKEVFQRDPLVGDRGFRTFLRSADPQVRASNDLFLAAPAAGRAEFFATDVLFLGDMPAASLSSRFCEMTREFVEEFGGGLVVVAGPRFGPAELAHTALGDMLPVVFDAARPRDDRPFELALTPEAALVDFMRLGADEAENRKAWKNLGRLPWWQPVSRPHPQATVLAVHPTENCADGRTPQPITALRRYGRGEVVYVGTNETWRLRRQYGERYYRQFWGQLMHRLGLGHALGSQKRFVVRTDATTYRTDDTVIVTVEAFDADFQPLAAEKLPDRTLAARLVRPDDPAAGAEKLAIAEVRPGLFEARIPALVAGEHRIVVDDPLTREAAQAAFTVTGLSVERRSAHRNVPLQEAIAAATGGRSYDLTTAARLVADIEPAARPEHALKVFPLSMTWACLLAGLGLLVAEWILRKRVSLP